MLDSPCTVPVLCPLAGVRSAQVDQRVFDREMKRGRDSMARRMFVATGAALVLAFGFGCAHQKIEALLAGLGIGHLPRHRIEGYLNDDKLIELKLESSSPESFIAWKISNKGKALQSISRRLASVKW